MEVLTKEELIQRLTVLERFPIIYRYLEEYYTTLDDDAKEWANNNWKSIQYALVEKMAEMIENRKSDN
jgi:hypothetical protein